MRRSGAETNVEKPGGSEYPTGMKYLSLVIMAILAGTGCERRPGEDWYDESVAHGQERDAFIQEQVVSGLSVEEARELHDRNTWKMNTIHLSQERGPELEVEDP